MPNVNFYWAGDGPYRDKILPALEKFDNFHWLGHLKYPDEVRQFFSEIDIYALVSGIDMSPHTLLEAGLMKKPILATNVGGISESCKDGETCFLIKENDWNDWIKNLTNTQLNQLKNDEKICFINKKINYGTRSSSLISLPNSCLLYTSDAADE